MAARMAIIAITTNNSISVKALICFRRFFINICWFPICWFVFCFLLTPLSFRKKHLAVNLIFDFDILLSNADAIAIFLRKPKKTHSYLVIDVKFSRILREN